MFACVILYRASQEGDLRGCYHHRDTRHGGRRCCCLRQNPPWSEVSQHRLGTALERGGQEKVLQELGQVQEEGLHRLRQAVRNRGRQEEHPVSAREDEEVRNCHPCLGPHSDQEDEGVEAEEGSHDGDPDQRWHHRTEGRLRLQLLREADSHRRCFPEG